MSTGIVSSDPTDGLSSYRKWMDGIVKQYTTSISMNENIICPVTTAVNWFNIFTELSVHLLFTPKRLVQVFSIWCIKVTQSFLRPIFFCREGQIQTLSTVYLYSSQLDSHQTSKPRAPSNAVSSLCRYSARGPSLLPLHEHSTVCISLWHLYSEQDLSSLMRFSCKYELFFRFQACQLWSSSYLWFVV